MMAVKSFRLCSAEYELWALADARYFALKDTKIYIVHGGIILKII